MNHKPGFIMKRIPENDLRGNPNFLVSIENKTTSIKFSNQIYESWLWWFSKIFVSCWPFRVSDKLGFICNQICTTKMRYSGENIIMRVHCNTVKPTLNRWPKSPWSKRNWKYRTYRILKVTPKTKCLVDDWARCIKVYGTNLITWRNTRLVKRYLVSKIDFRRFTG